MLPFYCGANNDNNARHLLAAADDDAVLVKNMGQSFRFSAVAVIAFIHS